MSFAVSLCLRDAGKWIYQSSPLCTEVHAAGGGIHFTVEKTRQASEQELLDLLVPRLWRMLRAGTTTVECKSGYGLNTGAELKMLRVLEAARPVLPIEISSTFCGAHAVPRGENCLQ